LFPCLATRDEIISARHDQDVPLSGQGPDQRQAPAPPGRHGQLRLELLLRHAERSPTPTARRIAYSLANLL
jgi:hypothetical protein